MDKEGSPKEFWLEGEETYVCRPCAQFSSSLEVPKALLKFRRGNFGFISRNTAPSKIKYSTSSHERNSLHLWCLQKEIGVMQGVKTDQEERVLGEQVIRNAIHCFKRSHSSEDFVALNSLNHLTPGIGGAVKNNSSKAFFEIRELVWEVLSERIKKVFQRGEGVIDHICVSLDKVTTLHTSYTVVCTYYFLYGRIYVFINELCLMDEDDYSSEGCAEALVACLTRTLGITRTRLAVILRHLAYDGVYATKEQRTAGGGYLSLILHVARVLGVAEGSITGTWDVSHLLQVTTHT